MEKATDLQCKSSGFYKNIIQKILKHKKVSNVNETHHGDGSMSRAPRTSKTEESSLTLWGSQICSES